jgi:hypothetical protein
MLANSVNADQAFQHLHGPNNEGLGPFSSIACTGTGSSLQVFGLISGNIWYTNRDSNGNWVEPFHHIHGPNNEGVAAGDHRPGLADRDRRAG